MKFFKCHTSSTFSGCQQLNTFVLADRSNVPEGRICRCIEPEGKYWSMLKRAAGKKLKFVKNSQSEKNLGSSVTNQMI